MSVFGDFGSALHCTQTEYGDLQSKSSYSVWIGKIPIRKDSK